MKTSAPGSRRPQPMPAPAAAAQVTEGPAAQRSAASRQLEASPRLTAQRRAWQAGFGDALVPAADARSVAQHKGPVAQEELLQGRFDAWVQPLQPTRQMKEAAPRVEIGGPVIQRAKWRWTDGRWIKQDDIANNNNNAKNLPAAGLEGDIFDDTSGETQRATEAQRMAWALESLADTKELYMQQARAVAERFGVDAKALQKAWKSKQPTAAEPKKLKCQYILDHIKKVKGKAVKGSKGLQSIYLGSNDINVIEGAQEVPKELFDELKQALEERGWEFVGSWSSGGAFKLRSNDRVRFKLRPPDKDGKDDE